MDKAQLAKIAQALQSSAQQLKKDAIIFEAEGRLGLTVKHIREELLPEIEDLYI